MQASIPKFKILVVDDDESILRVVRRLLGRTGIPVEVRTFTKASEAIEDLKQNRYDLVVSDLCMPLPEAGYRVAKFMKKNSPGTPFHLVSGGHDGSYEKALADLGVQVESKNSFLERLTRLVRETMQCP